MHHPHQGASKISALGVARVALPSRRENWGRLTGENRSGTGGHVKRFTEGNVRRRRIHVPPALKEYLRKTERFRAGRDPIRLMRTGPAKFARAVEGLRPAQLRKRPASGKWSIQEILGHLADTEVVYGYRYRMAIGQSGSPIQGYDQERWVVELEYNRKRWSAKRLLEQIAALRRSTLYLFENMPRDSAKRFGMHSERGRETVRRTQELIAGHDLNHLDQIRAIRRKYGW
jgi:hypothetical protein